MILLTAMLTTIFNAGLLYAADWYRASDEQPQKNSFLDKDSKTKPLSHLEASRINQLFGTCNFMGTLEGKRTIGVFDCKGKVVMEFVNV